MTFSEKCKSLGTTPDDFSLFVDTPKRTLNTWMNTKPKLMSRLFDSYIYERGLIDGDLIPGKQHNNALCIIERLKMTIDTLERVDFIYSSPKEQPAAGVLTRRPRPSGNRTKPQENEK